MSAVAENIQTDMPLPLVFTVRNDSKPAERWAIPVLRRLMSKA